MRVVQVRMPEKLIEEVDKLVKKKIYSTRSDVIRDATRKFVVSSYTKNFKRQ
ncbi:MAG: ribbon-helix-helix domain-containing protein [Candidatus Aenigmatarchaeota archaeon]|nr:ribbon-helix-helix domain-containing protein [Candidatus Aenigmarchaeota archaeon]